jgi:hypothetical protein
LRQLCDLTGVTTFNLLPADPPAGVTTFSNRASDFDVGVTTMPRGPSIGRASLLPGLGSLGCKGV